jgi:hypothetical protein
MGRRSGKKLYAAPLMIKIESLEDIALIALGVKDPVLDRPVIVESSQLIHRGVRSASFDLPGPELDEPIEMLDIAVAEQLVLQHLAKGRREGEREAIVDTIGVQTLENAQ